MCLTCRGSTIPRRGRNARLPIPVGGGRGAGGKSREGGEGEGGEVGEVRGEMAKGSEEGRVERSQC